MLAHGWLWDDRAVLALQSSVLHVGISCRGLGEPHTGGVPPQLTPHCPSGNGQNSRDVKGCFGGALLSMGTDLVLTLS